MAKQPAFKLRDGLISATIWENPSENGIFHSINIVRSYTDGNGEWKETTSFSGSDLLKAANLLQRAYNWTLAHRDGGKDDAAAPAYENGTPDEIPF